MIVVVRDFLLHTTDAMTITLGHHAYGCWLSKDGMPVLFQSQSAASRSRLASETASRVFGSRSKLPG